MLFQVESSQQQGTPNSGVIRGIIAKEVTWCTNEEREKWTDPNKIKGFGQRYRVRIVGVHDQKEIPDDKLPLCSVVMPVTAGSGHANSSQTSNIKEGTWVKLEAQDGANGTEFLITGILPNDSQNQTLPAANDQKGFDNKSGYNSTDPYRANDGVAEFGLTENGEKTEANSGSDSVEKIKIDNDEEFDGKKEANLPSKRKCGGDETQGVQIFLRDLIQDIEELKKPLGAYSGKLGKTSGGVDGKVDQLCDRATDFIAGKIKNAIEEIRKNTLSQVKETIKQEYGKVWEEDQPKLKKTQDKIWDKISCLFNSFIDQLPKMVGELVCPLAKKIINAPSCVAQSIGGSIISQILGPLIALIDMMLKPLLALLGIAGGIGNILSLIQGLTGSFSCEKDEDCKSLLSWSTWDGPGTIAAEMQSQFGLSSLFGVAAGFASQLQGLGGQIQGLIGMLSATTGVDFGSMFDAGSAVGSIASGSNGCSGDPVRCGPPTVSFFGQAKNAVANAIVSSTGDVLGMDIIDPGSTFKSFNVPEVMVQDYCRNGSGATAFPTYAKVKSPQGRSIINNTGGQLAGAGGVIYDEVGGTGRDGLYSDQMNNGTDAYVLTGIVVDYEGYDYLPKPDGSKGGDGRVWAKKDETIVRRSNLDWDTPYRPGEEIKLKEGDQITLPDNSKIDFPIELVGGVVKEITNEDILGVAQEDVITVTAPFPIEDEGLIPRGNADTYGVYLTICNPVILRSGYNYSPNDKIKIFPEDRGAVLEPVFGPNGTLEEINVLNPGSGFDFWPTIYVESETGYNAKIAPNFCVNRLDDDLKEVPPGTTIIQVVDCVGKITSKR